MARNSILWQHIDPIGSSIYLLGTIHLNSNSIRYRKNDLMRILTSVDQVHTETELEQLSGIEFQKKLVFPGGLKLNDHLSEKQYDRMLTAVRKFTGIGLETIDRLQPMIIQNIIAQHLLSSGVQSSPDEFVHHKAIENELPVYGIESSEEQLQVFQQIELEYQLVMLKRFTSNLSGNRQKLIQQLQLYNTEKIHQLYRLAKMSLGMLKELMLFQRNRNMADRIYSLRKGPNALVAVGAAHLSGGKGILHLCHQKGMTFAPVDF